MNSLAKGLACCVVRVTDPYVEKTDSPETEALDSFYCSSLDFLPNENNLKFRIYSSPICPF